RFESCCRHHLFNDVIRMDGREVEGSAVLTRQTRKSLVGSNPTPSARFGQARSFPWAAPNKHFGHGRGSRFGVASRTTRLVLPIGSSRVVTGLRILPNAHPG